MEPMYEVGFKDVYPWVWAVMFGVALTLGERRGAFMAAGIKTMGGFWAKNLCAVLLLVVVPAVFFGLTMVRLGPLYPPNMDFWEILGALYLAGLPLGVHHLWMIPVVMYGWMPSETLQPVERDTWKRFPYMSVVWAGVAFGIPALAAVFRWKLPF